MNDRFRPPPFERPLSRLPGTARLVAVERPGGLLWVRVARSFLQRAVGLLATPALPPDQGLLILPCSSVHTFAMGYPLDLVFLDGEARVVEVRPALPPWRTAHCRDARAVLELAAGAAALHRLVPGEQLPELDPWLTRLDRPAPPSIK